MGDFVGDFVGDKACQGEGATHHLACFCRERQFAIMQAKFNEARYLLEKLMWTPALDPDESRCRNCRNTRAEGHTKTCRVAYILSND